MQFGGEGQRTIGVGSCRAPTPSRWLHAWN